MSPNLSLACLQALLQDDVEEIQPTDSSISLDRAKLASSIERVWNHFGVPSAPETRVWRRPMSDSLYRCPLSAPRSTLVPWKSLPAPVQAKLRASGARIPVSNSTGEGHIQDDGEHDDSPGIVEIPLEYLEGSGQDSTDGKSRSIQGNLSDKLSQFTRGLEGQLNRPFRPGGMEEDTDKKDKAINDPYRTAEMVERSQIVLSQGTEASWRDKRLITAPPGMSFDVGLSWNDIYGGDTVESSSTINDPKLNPFADPIKSAAVRQSESAVVAAEPQIIFTKGYFDDDSLFGSSSSESDVDSEEDSEPTGDAKIQPDLILESVKQFAATGCADDDIDQLLKDLTVSDDSIYGTKKHDGNTALQKQFAEKQPDKTRRTWATDTLFPIDDFNALIPNPALTYPFTLDDFQQQAVARLERSESVFVAAHTSAGKTVVAEYAIALAKQRATRCIYTSPIKALSNQKFRDFCRKFGSEHVGLMTGDLQVNVDNSSCLIMTTEILRSMLYRGADLIRDIEFVVFDEVHYVNDTERGVVWEEVIVLLPSKVTMIFLSATTPNSFEFSDWIGRTKQKEVHVIKTDYRPVPLSHFLWAGTKLHKVLQGKGSFIEKGYLEASKALLPSSATNLDKRKSDQNRRLPTGSKDLAWQAQGNKQNWVSLVRYLDKELLTPAVVFSFSKKKCEELAHSLASLDLNTAKEGCAVQGFAIQAVARLSKNDAELPQVLSICEMVKRGIGIHHGGLLPILKEMVEILFSRNLIKVLFATETFAMGVNMPAKAVVFNSIRKHDGNQFRLLEPGEYTQMAGRAGRRGLDKVGTVILCCFGEVPPPHSTIRQMLTGTSTRLSSNFRLTYGMILNLLKSEAELSVAAMIKWSFSEFATQRALAANKFPQLLIRGERTLQKLDEQFQTDSAQWIGVDDLEDYFAVCSELLTMNNRVLCHLRESDYLSFNDICHPGRIILITAARSYHVVRAPAIVLRSAKPDTSVQGKTSGLKSDYLVCFVLMPSSFTHEEHGGHGTVAPFGHVGHIGRAKQRCFAIREVEIYQVLLVSHRKNTIDSKLLLEDDLSNKGLKPQKSPGHFYGASDPFAGMKAVRKPGHDISSGTGTMKKNAAVDEIMTTLLDTESAERKGNGIAILPLSPFLKRGSDVVDYRKLCDRAECLTRAMRSFTSHQHPNLEKYYKNIERKDTLRSRVQMLRHLLSNESLHLFPDFLQRKNVLLRLGYIEQNESVLLKGLLNDLDPPEFVAVLSGLVWQEKTKDQEFDDELPQKLVVCCNSMKVIATNLGWIQKEAGLSIDPGEYCDASLRFGLVHVVYEWALGIAFRNICELTDAHEGSIVRCITRLDELCREVRNIARVMGNPTLYRTAEAASSCIKRDIVFASSLYVS